MYAVQVSSVIKSSGRLTMAPFALSASRSDPKVKGYYFKIQKRSQGFSRTQIPDRTRALVFPMDCNLLFNVGPRLKLLPCKSSDNMDRFRMLWTSQALGSREVLARADSRSYLWAALYGRVEKYRNRMHCSDLDQICRAQYTELRTARAIEDRRSWPTDFSFGRPDNQMPPNSSNTHASD